VLEGRAHQAVEQVARRPVAGAIGKFFGDEARNAADDAEQRRIVRIDAQAQPHGAPRRIDRTGRRRGIRQRPNKNHHHQRPFPHGSTSRKLRPDNS